jgi:hypothetical protein
LSGERRGCSCSFLPYPFFFNPPYRDKEYKAHSTDERRSFIKGQSLGKRLCPETT